MLWDGYAVGGADRVHHRAGDGPLAREMEAMIFAHPQGHRVFMTGRVPMDRLVALMGQYTPARHTMRSKL